MMSGLQTTAILQAGIELGVFDRIAAGRTDAASIADDLGASLRGARILLDALAALGILEGDGEGYRLTPLSEAFLVSGSPTYVGGMSRILAGAPAWAAYPRLAEAVRSGGTLLDEHAETPEHAFWEAFAPSSMGIAAPAAHALAAVLAGWAAERPTLSVLDVACGSGLYSLTLAGAQPHAQVTLLDWPNVLAITRGTVERLGLAERTRYIEGDAFEAPLEGPYDLITVSHFFHHFSEERCLELLRRLSGALAPGGRLAINDFAAAGDRPADEPFPRLFSVIMLTWSREGEAHTLDTYRRLLEESGFRAPDVHEAAGMPSRILVAERREPDRPGPDRTAPARQPSSSTRSATESTIRVGR